MRSLPFIGHAILCGMALAAMQPARAADTVALRADGQPALTYRQTPNPNKVYVSELYTPGGVQVLLDSPGDHVHHHALMLGLDVDGVSFWMDGKQMGAQRPRAAAKVTANTLEQTLDWVTPDGCALLVETRRLMVHPVENHAFTLVTWHSTLTPADGVNQVSLYTTRAYAGLGLRLPKSMDAKATFTFSGKTDSTPVRNTETVTGALNAACTGPVADKTVTVAMLSHPHRRRMTHWFTMSDSLTYMTATMNLYRQPRVLRQGQTIEVAHAIAAWDGIAEASDVSKAQQLWARTVCPSAAPGWEATHDNVARHARGVTATASSVYGEGYEARKAIDGKWAVRETDKWNSKQNITPHYLKLDLGRIHTIDRIRIVHEGILPGGQALTTSDFRLQGSLRQWGPFKDLTAPVHGNTEAISEHVFDPQDVRFVRLLIETSEQNDRNAYGRILELQVYSPINSAQEKEQQ